jgi:hypothetical protein
MLETSDLDGIAFWAGGEIFAQYFESLTRGTSESSPLLLIGSFLRTPVRPGVDPVSETFGAPLLDRVRNSRSPFLICSRFSASSSGCINLLITSSTVSGSFRLSMELPDVPKRIGYLSESSDPSPPLRTFRMSFLR